jgi:ABC-type Fe3+ transport system permease subunit
MTAAALGLVVVFLLVGLALGWHSQRSYAAHADVKVAKNRLRGGRRTRWRSALFVLILGALTALVLKDMLHL